MSPHDPSVQIPVESYFDPLAELQRLLEELLAHNKQAMPFYHPVDPVRDEMPDYLDIVQQPMDLGTVVHRLRIGWYEESEHAELIARGTRRGSGTGRRSLVIAKMEEEEQQVNSTRGTGCKGVLEDVRLVWANCEKYHGLESSLTELAQTLSDELEEQFERRVLTPLERKEKALERMKERAAAVMTGKDGASSSASSAAVSSKETDWGVVIDQLGKLSYAELPVGTRVAVLRWLADEVVGTAAVRELLDKIGPARDRAKKLGAKRKAWADAMADGRGQGYASSDLWTAAEEKELTNAIRVANLETRLRPLGVDRYGRR